MKAFYLLTLCLVVLAQEPAADLLAAAVEYRDSLIKLKSFYVADVKRAEEALEKRRVLFEQGIVSRRELQLAERNLELALAKMKQIDSQILEAEQIVAEAEMTKEKVDVSEQIIRYVGYVDWSIADIEAIRRFFYGRFKYELPVTAYGQSSTHEKLGLDHTDSVDVGLHPDSEQGQALMEFLRSNGIPFLAFRSALAGVSTGAHIHIGRPSQRKQVFSGSRR
ncbi:MAG: hypothetical protein RMM17_11510 [Acidobacteriota bacterium]|nr:hypothetical protein [Blastocatellia bacterium]MDW8413299.1 hypothetical protein [Acidobacteriota bacterium]